MSEKYFSELYMTAEDAITAFRKACDFGDSNIDIDVLSTARYELETLKQYINVALGEISIQTDKFYEE